MPLNRKRIFLFSLAVGRNFAREFVREIVAAFKFAGKFGGSTAWGSAAYLGYVQWKRKKSTLFRNDDAAQVETSVLVDVCVSHKRHLRLVQVGNACVKEGNTHVNGEGYNTSVRSEPCKLRNSRSICNFTFLTNITVSACKYKDVFLFIFFVHCSLQCLLLIIQIAFVSSWTNYRQVLKFQLKHCGMLFAS